MLHICTGTRTLYTTVYTIQYVAYPNSPGTVFIDNPNSPVTVNVDNPKSPGAA